MMKSNTHLRKRFTGNVLLNIGPNKWRLLWYYGSEKNQGKKLNSMRKVTSFTSLFLQQDHCDLSNGIRTYPVLLVPPYTVFNGTSSTDIISPDDSFSAKSVPSAAIPEGTR